MPPFVRPPAWRLVALAIGVAAIGASCRQPPRASTADSTSHVPSLTRQPFGTTPDGTAVEVFTFTTSRGAEARITNYGGTVVSIKVPDRNGRLGDVVHGFDTFDGYLSNTPFFGVIVGRYGNRIAKGRFSLDGTTYTLARNDGENHLHGGLKGFDKRVWTPRIVSDADGPSLQLDYVSADGEEGYPGTLHATVVYTFTEQNELRIAYAATTDKKTVVNLTNHTYFNLSGAGDILADQILIDADRFTPVDTGLIPTGELKNVAGTPFDFRTATPIGARIDQDRKSVV